MSQRYAVLLRGVNLGGHRKIAMADLRALLEGLGYDDVKTHLQSGNAVLTTTSKPEPLVRKVEAQISRELGLEVDVIVRTHAELASIVKRSPYRPGLNSPSQYLVSFLASKPSPQRVKALAPDAYAPDKFWVDDREVYLWCPNGVGKSKLPKDFFAKALGVSASARNWNTVTKLVELTAPG